MGQYKVYKKSFDKISKMFKTFGAFLVLLIAFGVNASSMSSSNYKIQSDSVNFGGGTSGSPTYYDLDTMGEVSSGISSSANYSLKAGFRYMQDVNISMTSVSDVTMSPNILGISGGTANGSASVTVTTDSQAGYALMIKASSSPALVSEYSSFADYTPASSDPDFNFVISNSDSEFGFTAEGGDIVQEFKDNGGSCNTGSSDTSDKCWSNLSTSNTTISQSSSSNSPTGVQTTIKFRAQSGSNHFQVEGIYQATTTITAIAL